MGIKKLTPKPPVTVEMPVGCRPLEILALALESVLKPQSPRALYQTKPSNAGIMRTLIISLAAKSETVHTVTTFRAGSNTLGLLNTSLSKLGKTMPALVIDRYENFHLTDVDMLLIAYTDTDTDQKKTNSPIPIRRKRILPIPMPILI